MSVRPTADLYYDPYDFEIDSDPYPVWQRLRDEHPLYYNERYDFYALSRFDDVERASVDWKHVQLGEGHGPRADQERHGRSRRARSSSRTRRRTTSTAACCRGSSRPGR